MPTSRQGAIRLFRFSGIDVFLHWSWFVVAVYEINGGFGVYSSISWRIAEYLCVFAIVTLHEFGHALACRQVGGRANQIVLWPLGGVAYVDPPPRPGATLWSIAAGPLVNVALFPVLFALGKLSGALGLYAATPDLLQLLSAVYKINFYLLAFNILPIYPLDGGQILRSLLWFVLGRARSLLVATILGFVGVAAFIGLAFWTQSLWTGAIAVFMLMNCWSGLQHARALLRLDKLPRRAGFACPACKAAPPVGDVWKCAHCAQSFDIFQHPGVCPVCGAQFPAVRCMECGAANPLGEWAAPASDVSSTFTSEVRR
ncbi:MAG: M50 family metallopeptidase [Terriglobales bacterium]|jgi:Zn-dependent protease